MDILHSVKLSRIQINEAVMDTTFVKLSWILLIGNASRDDGLTTPSPSSGFGYPNAALIVPFPPPQVLVYLMKAQCLING